jgi:hypothetical protein
MNSHPQTCKNCGNHFTGNYCNACGEKVYGPKDKSLWHLLEEAFHFISHFEGKLLLTLKTMFTHPGKYAADYCDGIRKKYFKPVSFFLLIVVLFLFVPSGNGLNMNISDHMQSWYGSRARNTVLHYMASHQIDSHALAVRYAASSEKVSKLLLFLLIPVMAGFAAIFTIRRKRPFFDHLIFSIETSGFFILWSFLIVRLLVWLLGLLIEIPEQKDPYTLPVMLAASLLYVFIAARRFYAFNPARCTLFTLLFMIILPLFIHYVYSSILFFTTMNLLH